MDDALGAELEALADEMTTRTRRSKDEWVRGHDAGTLTAGRRLKDLLEKYPAPAAVRQ